MKSLWLALPLLAFATVSHAQERTAAGGAETQMTWSALSTQINATNTKVDAVNARVDQSVLCGKKGKIYAPGIAGADADGCIEASATNGTTLTNILNTLSTLSTNVTNLGNTVTSVNNCGKAGQFFNGTACVAATTPVPSGTVCGASSNSTEVGRPLVFSCYGHDPKSSCPAGYAGATVPIWGGKNGQSISYCFKQ